MMRGELDMSIDRHSAIEQRLYNNLDTWLCNLYFEIKRLPRYTEGQREYEVELQYSSGMLGYPQRPDTTETAETALASVLPTSPSARSPLGQLKAAAHTSVSAPNSPHLTRRRMTVVGAGEEGEQQQQQQGAAPRRLSRMLMGLNMEVQGSGGGGSSGGANQSGGGPAHRRSRRGRPMPLPSVPDTAESGSDTEAVSPGAPSHRRTSAQETPAKADPPLPPSPTVKTEAVDEELVYRVSQAGPTHLYAGNMIELQPGNNGKGPARRGQKVRALSRAEQLERHLYSVRPQELDMRGDLDFHNKTAYIRRQLSAELGPSQFKTSPFWVSVLCLLLAFWGRLYIHYVAQWLLLSGIGIPVSEFAFHAFTVSLNYQR